MAFMKGLSWTRIRLEARREGFCAYTKEISVFRADREAMLEAREGRQ